MSYNDVVMDYNNVIAVFPNSLIAGSRLSLARASPLKTMQFVRLQRCSSKRFLYYICRLLCPVTVRAQFYLSKATGESQ